MIDAAVIGLGWWGRHIVASLQGHSDKIRFVRAVDIDPAAASGFAAEHGLGFSTDFADALGDAAVQAVVLTTPHSLHELQVAAAAKAGKHVFCEKPLALTKAGAERAVAACGDAGVVLGVGHERRFEPALVEIERLAGDGELGEILHAEANFSHDSFTTFAADNWRLSGAEAPGAGMTGMGVHLTDSLIHILGKVESVFALSARRVVPVESGDVISVLMTFASGVTGYLNVLLATPLYLRFRIFGTRAWVEAADTARPEAAGISHLTLCRQGGEPETRRVPSIDTVRPNLEAFAEACAGGPPYLIDDREKVHNIAVLEAVVRSAETGQPVAVA